VILVIGALLTKFKLRHTDFPEAMLDEFADVYPVLKTETCGLGGKGGGTLAADSLSCLIGVVADEYMDGDLGADFDGSVGGVAGVKS